MKSPKVTVLMSVYNGQKYLRQAIDSILNQTFMDFEFLIINDGSIDRTAEILEGYRDSRIRIINNEKNIGLTKSLNKGLKIARGEYIARMDADDISEPTRLEKQVRFLDANKACLALGTWANVIDENGKKYNTFKYPERFVDIKKGLMTYNPIVHGAVMARKITLITCGGYNEKFLYAQDFDLWLRLSEIGQLRNLPEALYSLRFWSDCISIAKAEKQKEHTNIAHQDAIMRRKCPIKRFWRKISW